METTRSERVEATMRGGVGWIVLNRPEAINALDLGMIRGVREALEHWRDEPDVSIVLLTGAGDRGFSAGGDIRALYAQIADEGAEATDPFFREEYLLDAAVAEYPKPIVAIADGATMGGGIGLAGNALVRVVTERSRLAMPETRIGFAPDAGGSWLLAHAPGRLGEYLALTSDAMNAADAIHCGFADHLVPSAHIASLCDALETRADPATPAELVMLFDETPQAGPLQRAQPWIDEAFAVDTLPEILERLRELGASDVAAGEEITPAGALAALEERSPTALVVTLAAIRSARALPSQRHALEQEYRLMSWFLSTQPDPAEGIRARVVDKDRAPRWSPASVSDVPDDTVGVAFAHPAPTVLFPDLER
ncbi:enoyl-CoA hydratase/isomerase family protein [Microbacterium betulae]|uniref:3-hydroxyisobutyryl-CoA hydrolase n=1 Tax=Microbacterium betulae TaxID=2981139 RepID=A0AA97FL02_9MICO|nr:enoyl-CoA hydratase/isomerase family protein [Microbacterium sp. AB]WOF24784.1 enoyl-CoA hydratase/isomerase family protein [Microbacterium sp. AB]